MDSDIQKIILLSKAYRIIHACDKNMIDAFCSEILNDICHKQVSKLFFI